MDINRESRIKIQWECHAHEYNDESKKEIISKVSKKFNIPKKNIKIEAKIIDDSLKGNESVQQNITESIQDPVFQRALFKDYLEINEIEGVDLETIYKIDEQINEKIDYDQYNKFGSIKLKRLEWSNFLSYGKDNSFDFTQLQGLVSLSSKPNPNQGGKTTFALSLLMWALYAYSGNKGDTQTDLFNRFLPNENELYVRCFIELNEQDYVIERKLVRPKKRTVSSKASQVVRYYRVVNGIYDPNDPLEEYDPEDMLNQSTDHTNKVIKESLCSRQDFQLVAAATGKDLDALITDTGVTERGKLFNRWVGLLPIQEKSELAKEKWTKEINPKLLSNQYDVDDLNQKIAGATLSITESEKTVAETRLKISESDARIVELNTEKQHTTELKSKVDPTLIKLDVRTLENKKDVAVENGKNYRAADKQFTENIEKLKGYTVQKLLIDQLNKEMLEVSVEITRIKTEVDNLLRQNKQLETSRTCPTCKRDYDDSTQKQINKQINENVLKIKSLNSETEIKTGRKTAVENELKTEQEKEKVVEERTRLELKQAQNNVLLEKTTSEYKEIVAKIKEYENNRETIARNAQIDIKIENINTKIQVENSVRDNHLRTVRQEEVAIENNKKNIAEWQDIIRRMSIEQRYVKHFKLYQDMCGKKGIQNMMLSKVIPVINSHINNLLDEIPFEQQDEFNMEVVLDDKNNVRFDILQEDKDGNVVRGDLASASGYELTLSAIALRSALAKISSFTKVNFLLMDEITGRVGDVNLQYVEGMLRAIKGDYQFIFLISHNSVVNDWCEQKVVVEKDPYRISKVSIM